MIPNEEIQFEEIIVTDDTGQTHIIEGGSPFGTIIRTYNGCPLLSHIVSLLENTTEHINIDAISDYLSSLNWGDCIINHLFTYDNNEGTIYSVIEL